MYFLTESCIIMMVAIAITSGLKCNASRCLRDSKMEGNIIGGNPASIEDFPHAVYLYMVYQKWICGSSILTQWVLITAAHCVDGIGDEFKIDAYCGHENLNKVTIIRKVNRFTAHARYRMDDHKEFDISLIFLEDELPLGKEPFLKRVTISNKYPLYAQKATVAGWGMTNDVTRERAVTLRSIVQKITDLQVCTSYKYWQPGLLCAGDSYEHRPTKGDSGSGLLVDSNHQIGIVAFRVNHMPEVVFYTNVSHYYSWIVDEITEECPLAEATDIDP